MHRKFLDTGDVVNLPKAPKPKTLTPRDERHLVRTYDRTQNLSIRSSYRDEEYNPTLVNRTTIAKVLRDNGLKPYKSANKKQISERNVDRRLDMYDEVGNEPP